MIGKVFFICTCATKNLGDCAIDFASYKFIKKIFKINEIVILTYIEFCLAIDDIRKASKPCDVFIYRGGGNMGNQYCNEEYPRQLLITNFPNNNIILLPQTVHFVDNIKKGDDIYSFLTQNEMTKKAFLNLRNNPLLKTKNEAINSFKKIYSAHKHLYIFARENFSYEIIKQLLPNSNIFLCPDMFLSYEFTKVKKNKNSDILLCLRDDIESNDSNNATILKRLLKSTSITTVTTRHEYFINFEHSRYAIEQKLSDFAKGKIVITDCLHGMLFAAVSGVPCIALPNYNHKIIGMYQWLKDYKNIYICSDVSKINDYIKIIDYSYSGPDTRIFKKYYLPLKKVLHKCYISSKRLYE